jgi:hypothetical protein
MSEQPILTPRDGLRFILIRYDTDAGMAQGVWEVVQGHSAASLVAATLPRRTSTGQGLMRGPLPPGGTNNTRA